MADLAMLARHLYMHEVLEICESVHKQMEEKRLTLYQQGVVQNVALENNMLNVQIQGPRPEDKTSSPMVIEMTDDHPILNENHMDCQSAVTHSTNDLIAVGSSEDAISTQMSVQLSSDNIAATSVDGSTAVYISNISAASSELQSAVFVPAVIEVASVHPESDQVIVECLDVQPASLITEHASEVTDCDHVAKDSETILNENPLPTDIPSLGSPCLEEMEGNVDIIVQDSTVKNRGSLKRKRGKSPRSPNSPGTGMVSEAGIQDSMVNVSSDVSSDPAARTFGHNTAFAEVSASTQDSLNLSDGDFYKGKLRERSIEEGGYIQLHRGKGRKRASRKTKQKSAVQQAARKIVQRGKKRMLPSKNELTNEEEKHACKECGLLFGRKYALIVHSIKHNHRTKEFKCPLCKKEFEYTASLRAHLIRHAQSRTETPIVEHNPTVASAPIKRQYICDICGRTFPKMFSLRMHMLKHTGVKPHACQICNKKFTHKYGLKMHQAFHEIEKQFKCHMCDKSFVTNRSLQEHVSTHTGETKYVCTVCGKTYHRASGLSKHIKKHRPKSEVRPYHCTQCERRFSEARDLQQHMNKHLGVKPFECEICGKCYSWKKDWYSHVKSHSVTEPFRCNICGKEFFEKSLYRRHVNKATHGKKGRIKKNIERVCTHCGKSFSQLREFRRHVNNHEGVKPFECLTCGVAWADARSLKRHVRTHTGERPYVCPVCNEAYIDARNLRKHMTKYHSNYIPCKIMLEKDSLQFHHQGTQVEHAVSFVPNELVEEAQPEVMSEETETVLVTEDVVDSVEAVQESVSSLSDQSIMQVVNYVLAQQGTKLQVTDQIETVEVEVDHVSEVL